ncbi:NAD-dependent succinate-semialdehyde dehydrogenase [Corynebacterium riegelii]|uniref:NAD-dependent succinate-semialdehyde dehydrogenase n=1 Tax=Corynebacterium riegelii TaxID=156976 RepID=UPI00288A57B5|nr:NAD-dependent succinate-semialdehyde dehydrogenase [Corynebacterium riegelii]
MTSLDLKNLPQGAFIAGEWVPASNGETFEVEDPRTGKSIGRVANTTPDDWNRAIDAAAAADQEFRKTTIEYRSSLLRTAHELINDQADALAEIIAAETGKPISEALAEVRYGNDFLKWYSDLIVYERNEVATTPSGEYEMLTISEPVGPSLLITPWNFPLAMVTRKVGAALAAGCVSILKPAAQTPYSAIFLTEVLNRAGVKPGVVSLLTTSNASEFSKQAMNRSEIRKVSFTGSTNVGRQLLSQASNQIQATSMELGGNAPFLVDENADLDEAAKGAVIAKFRNAGQACVAANRIIVHSKVCDEFTEKFVREVENLRASWKRDDPTFGPMISEIQRDNLEQLLADASDNEGKILAGGHRIDGEGYYFEPTVIEGLSETSKLYCNEIFGPVAAIYAADDFDEMLAMANNTEYGLVAYLYSKNEKRIRQAIETLEVGMFAINRPIISEARAPFGGVKQSGIGREGGLIGLDDYRVTKYVARQLV